MNIFVSNISFHTTENLLQEMFSKFGIVKSVKIIMDKATGRSRGFGFVEMDSDAEGDTAIQSLHNKEIEGRQLSVSVARERSNDDRNSFSKKW